MSGSAAREFKQAWRTSERHGANMYDGTPITKVHQRFVLEVPVREAGPLVPAATTFANAFHDDPHGAYARSALSLVLETASRLRIAHEKLRASNVQVVESGDFMRLFLEYVPSTRDDPAIDATVRTQYTRMQSPCRFAVSVPLERAPAAYRLHVFVRTTNTNLDFASVFMSIIDESAGVERDFHAPRKRGGTSEALSFTSYSGGEPPKFASTFTPETQYRRFSSRGQWADFVDKNLGKRLFAGDARIDAAATRLADNPASPTFTLAPQLVFMYKLKGANPVQLDASAYTVGARSSQDGWTCTFPVVDCVLALTPVDERHRIFNDRFLPHYQHLCVNAAKIDAYVARFVTRRDDDDDDIVASVVPPAARIFDEAGDLGALDDDDGAGALVDPAYAFDDDDGDDDDDDIGRDVSAVERISSMLAELRVNATKTHESTDTSTAELVRATLDADTTLTAATTLVERWARCSVHYTLRAEGEELRAELTARTDARETLAAVYAMNRMRLLRQYAATAVGPTAAVTETMRAVNAWFAGQTNKWLGNDAAVPDHRAGTTTALLQARLTALEGLYDVAVLHRPAVLAQMCGADRHRIVHALHTNLLLTGPPSTGKSFIGTILAIIFIAGTVVDFDTSSGAARNVDRVCDGALELVDELDRREHAAVKDGGDVERERALKRLLSTCVLMRLVPYVDQNTAQRLNRIIATSSVGVRIGNTNDDPSLFTAPVRMRYLECFVTHENRADHRNVAARTAQSGVNHETEQRRVAFTRAMHAEDFIIAQVYQAIGIAALTPPTTAAYSALAQIVTQRLVERHGITVDPRRIEMGAAIAEKLVIITRMHNLYSNPKGPLYKKDFKHEQLAAFDPILYDDAAIAYTTFELLRSSIVDRKLALVVAAMRAHWQTQAKRIADMAPSESRALDVRALYLMPASLVQRGSQALVAPPSARPNKRRRETGAWAANGAELFSMNPEVERESAADVVDETYLYQYVRLGDREATTARVLVAATLDRDDAELTAAHFYAVFKELRSRFIKVPRRQIDDNGDVHASESGPVHRIPAYFTLGDGVYVALQMLIDADPLTEALEYAQSAAEDVAEIPYVTSLPAAPGYPHLAAVRTARVADGRRHRVTNYTRQLTVEALLTSVKAGDDVDMTRVDDGVEELAEPLREYSRHTREPLLYLPRDDPSTATAHYDAALPRTRTSKPYPESRMRAT